MLLLCFTLEILSECRETIARCDKELYDSSVFQIYLFFSVGRCHVVRSLCLARLSFSLSLFSGADNILTARPQVSLHTAFASDEAGVFLILLMHSYNMPLSFVFIIISHLLHAGHIVLF